MKPKQKLIFTEKSIFPQIHTENPVLSLGNSLNYLPLSRSSSRNINLSPESLISKLKSPREIFSFASKDQSNFEEKLENLLEKSKNQPSLNIFAENISILTKKYLNHYSASEKPGLFKLLESLLTAFQECLDDLIRYKSLSEKFESNLFLEKNNSKDFLIEIKQLKSQLQSFMNKSMIFEKQKTENSHSIEVVNRKYIIEREKLIEKVEMLEGYISELKNVTKIEMISSELDHYKELYEKTSKEYKKFSKEKEAQIYKLQMLVGSLKEDLSSNKAYMENFHIERKKYEEEIKDLKNSEILLKQKLNESREQLSSYKEDTFRFFYYKDLYELALEEAGS